LEAFLVSTGIVALAEIGEKTQLLAFILAAKFRNPAPIVIGILVATVANHAFAGGTWIVDHFAHGAANPALGAWHFIHGYGDLDLIPDTFELPAPIVPFSARILGAPARIEPDSRPRQSPAIPYSHSIVAGGLLEIS